MKTRTDVPVSAIPGINRRTDIPVYAVPGSSRGALAVEWIGRLAAVAAVVLFGLTLTAVHRGQAVQASSKEIVQNFHVANDFFSSRADFQAATRARDEMQQLAVLLADLRQVTDQDVQLLGSTLPDVERLAAAGRGDVRIAERMRAMGLTLQGAAGDLRKVAVDSNKVVGDIGGLMDRAVEQVKALNEQLALTERKLAAIPVAPQPATPGSAPAGNAPGSVLPNVGG